MRSVSISTQALLSRNPFTTSSRWGRHGTAAGGRWISTTAGVYRSEAAAGRLARYQLLGAVRVDGVRMQVRVDGLIEEFFGRGFGLQETTRRAAGEP
jgi:hypothetical protein